MKESTLRAALANMPSIASAVLPILQKRLNDCGGDADTLEIERAAQAAFVLALNRSCMVGGTNAIERMVRLNAIRER